MNAKISVENDLKWIVITSGHKNESWGDENYKKTTVYRNETHMSC